MPMDFSTLYLPGPAKLRQLRSLTFDSTDVILFLCTLMLLRSRAELARYRHIDEKSGYASI